MKINGIKKIVVEDYELDDRNLVQRLALTLNGFLDQVTTALNGNITTKDNQKSKIYRVDLPAGTSSKLVAWDLNEKPTSAEIAQLTLRDGTSPAAVFSLSWRYDPSKGIYLTFIGLDGSTHHSATVIAKV